MPTRLGTRVSGTPLIAQEQEEQQVYALWASTLGTGKILWQMDPVVFKPHCQASASPPPHPQCDQGLGYNRDIMSRTLASKPNPIAQYLPTGRASPSLA